MAVVLHSSMWIWFSENWVRKFDLLGLNHEVLTLLTARFILRVDETVHDSVFSFLFLNSDCLTGFLKYTRTENLYVPSFRSFLYLYDYFFKFQLATFTLKCKNEGMRQRPHFL